MVRLSSVIPALAAAAALLAGTVAAGAPRQSGPRGPAAPPPTYAAAATPAVVAFQPNYLAVAHLDSPIPCRWPRLPVRVCFIREGGDTPERERCVLAGFEEWTAATGGVLRYVVTGTPTAADVLVYLRSAAHLTEGLSTVGLTHTQSRGRWLVLAQMSLATGGPVTPELLTEVAAHEWGHALGIRGHSDDPDDLMYVTTVRAVSTASAQYEAPPRPRTPTPRDINTMKTIYADLFAPVPPGPPAEQARRYRAGG